MTAKPNDLKVTESEKPAAEATPPTPPAEQKKRRFGWPKSKKWQAVIIAALILVIAGLLVAIPATRYGILGRFVQRTVTLEVLDSRTHKPVSEASVQIAGQKLKTNAKGLVTVSKVPAGSESVGISKKYYNLINTDILVPLFAPTKTYQFQLVAVGNQVTVKVINKISGKPVEKAGIAALGTTALTDANGEAVIVLPVDKTSEAGAVKADGYNGQSITIQNTETLTAANTFSLVPSGKIYFLSKRTGKINVMKSDLDGGNATVVVAGTGSEDDTDTVLLATRDWKYLAFKAQRDKTGPKLYVINTTTDKMDIIDEGKAGFTPVGWSGHHFVFSVSRNDIVYWQPKQNAIKTYDAEKDTLATIDETNAAGSSSYDYAVEYYPSLILVDGKLVYVKAWTGSRYLLESQKAAIVRANLATNAHDTLQEFPAANTSIIGKLYRPDEVIYQITLAAEAPQPATTTFYEYEKGKLAKDTTSTTASFNQFYPTFVESPSGDFTFWSEPRDGKNTLFKGNSDGGDEKELATLSEFTPYGWYTDDYMLVSKSGSELYIVPADFSTKPVKVTDYHKPNFNSVGYGGGYGGF